MSETIISYALKYEDGRYISWDNDHFPLTHKLREARRFVNTEQIAEFVSNSFYRPEVYGLNPADFEIIELEITYRERENSEREHGGIRKSS